MEINQALETLQVQKAFMVSMAKQLELLEQTIEEHEIARETLENLQGKEAGTEILMPIGAATKVFVSLRDFSKVIVNIGSGVEMEMTIDKAIDHHSSFIDQFIKEREKIRQKLRELNDQSAALSAMVEQAYVQQMHQNPPPGSVQGRIPKAT